MVEFLELSMAEQTDHEMLRRFYSECLVPAFPDPDERESLENIQKYLWLKQRGELGANNYHVLVVLDGDAVVAGSVSAYLEKPSAGAIEYLFVNPEQRGKGLANHLLEATEHTLAADAESARRAIELIIAEIQDPFRTPRSGAAFDPFKRAAIWHRWGYRVMDFPYVQRALTPQQATVDTLLLITRTFSAEFEQSIPPDRVLTVLHEYLRWVMQIPVPREEPTFAAMAEHLSGVDGPIPLIALSDYVSDDASKGSAK